MPAPTRDRSALGRGNEQPTITDAHIVLGRLNPERYLDGGVKLHPDLAERAIGELAAKLGMSEAEAASGILRIGNANMTAATHLISVQRGYDPREFALVAGGGAGPLHAVDIARELGIPVVIVPPTPGVTSALGILQVDLRHDIMRSVLAQTPQIDPVDLARVFKELEAEAAEILEGEQIPEDRRRIELSIDVRYYGQTPYLNLPLDEAPDTRAAIDAARRGLRGPVRARVRLPPRRRHRARSRSSTPALPRSGSPIQPRSC